MWRYPVCKQLLLPHLWSDPRHTHACICKAYAVPSVVVASLFRKENSQQHKRPQAYGNKNHSNINITNNNNRCCNLSNGIK